MSSESYFNQPGINGQDQEAEIPAAVVPQNRIKGLLAEGADQNSPAGQEAATTVPAVIGPPAPEPTGDGSVPMERSSGAATEQTFDDILGSDLGDQLMWYLQSRLESFETYPSWGTGRRAAPVSSKKSFPLRHFFDQNAAQRSRVKLTKFFGLWLFQEDQRDKTIAAVKAAFLQNPDKDLQPFIRLTVERWWGYVIHDISWALEGLEDLILSACEPIITEQLAAHLTTWYETENPLPADLVTVLEAVEQTNQEVADRLSLIRKYAFIDPIAAVERFPRVWAIFQQRWQETYPQARAERERREEEEYARQTRRQLNNEFEAAGLSAVTGDDFDDEQDDSALSWLVPDVLVQGQPGVLGGPMKSLKTSLTIDLAVSIATATPFLGRFSVPSQATAVVFSGESGVGAMKNLIRRIAKARGIGTKQLAEAFKEGRLVLIDGVPQFGKSPRKNSRASRQATNDLFLSLKNGYPVLSSAARDGFSLLEAVHQQYNPDLVVIDPLFKTLKADENINQGSVFEMGQLLYQIDAVCQRHDSTLLFNHHTTKGIAPGREIGLTDLSQAGVGEFSRQWLTTNRRGSYRHDGRHSLIVSFNGSAGHSSVWDVTVDEGPMDTDQVGRTKWEVVVEPHKQRTANKDQDNENKPPTKKARQYGEQYLAALRELAPSGQWTAHNLVRDRAKLSGSNGRPTVETLQSQGLIETQRANNKLEVRLRGK